MWEEVSESVDIHCLSWFSNDRSTAKEIDHVLVNTRWSLLRTCRVYRSLEFDSDHMAVVATLTLRLKRLSRLRSSLRRFYRAMHFSAKRGIAIACRLSVCPSVCDVGGL